MPNFFLWIFLMAAGGQAATPACEKTRADLEQFLERLDRSCQADADCTGQYLRADACKPAVVISRKALGSDQERKLLAWQKQTRESCGKEWSSRPTCSPIPFSARCVSNRCTDRAEAVNIPKEEPESGSYPYALATRSCAPWDGAAFAITLTQSRQSCDRKARSGPYLSLVIYQNIDTLKPGTIVLGVRAGQAARCEDTSNGPSCRSAQSGRITMDHVGPKGEVSGSYELQFPNAPPEKGSFKSELCPEPALCGGVRRPAGGLGAVIALRPS
jgi:hypothetical protein